VTDQEVCNALDTLLAPLYKPALSNTATYYGLRVKKIWPLPVFIPVTRHSHTGAGTGDSIPAPAQLSGIITKQTAGVGRSKRGRIYIPFPSTAYLDTDSTPTATYLTVLGAIAPALFAGDTIVGASGTANILPIIWGRVAHSMADVTASRVNDKFATQRRRGEYGRQNTIPPF